MNGSDQEFVDYYLKELEYLRFFGADFSKTYPKIAKNLHLYDTHCADPHVERLLESFAFLTAGLKQKIDQKAPEVAVGLLEALCPTLLTPMPAMAIARFEPSTTKTSQGQIIAKGSVLSAHGSQEQTCYFKTVYPVHLSGIQTTKAALVPLDVLLLDGYNRSTTNWFLHLRLKSHGASFDKMVLDYVRIYLNATSFLAPLLYEAIFCQANDRIYISTKSTSSQYVCHGFSHIIEPVGFKEEELTFPSSPYSLYTHQFLQEYFHFPEKFFFFDVLLNKCLTSQRIPLDVHEIDFFIPIQYPKKILQSNINADMFCTHCTVVVNAYEKISDPFKIDYKKFEYKVISDQRRQETIDVLKVEKVFFTNDDNQKVFELPPYYGFHHHTQRNDLLYWVSKRKKRSTNSPIHDVFLSFVDLNFTSFAPTYPVIYAQLLCSNTLVASTLDPKTPLQMEQRSSIKSITLLNKPTQPYYPNLGSNALWQLVTQLGIDYVGMMGDGDHATNMVKEMLFLYAQHQGKQYAFEHDLEKVTVANVVERLYTHSSVGFVNGINLSMHFRHHDVPGNTHFLLASILHRYFSSHVHINTFMKTTMYTNEQTDPWMTWHPKQGSVGVL
jgi:type VI secretion system protein ImpG